VHVTSNPVDWYAIRASGLVAYLLLTAVVAVGLALAGKERLRRWPRFALADVHRFGSLLVGLFVSLHVLTLTLDAYLPFTVGQLVVPFASSYRPLWTGLGVAGAELLLALALTNRFRQRLSYRFWRRAHYLTFVVWAAATAHGIGAGTDSSAGWNVAVYGVSVSLVAGLVVRRVARVRAGAAPLPRPELAAAGAGLLVVVLLVAVPLGATHARAAGASAAAVPGSVRDTLTGQIVAQRGFARELVSLTGRGAGRQPLVVRADLLVSEDSQDTSLQLEFLPSGTLCVGSLTNVASSSFDGTCSLPGGATRAVHAQWSPAADGTLRGTIAAG